MNNCDILKLKLYKSRLIVQFSWYTSEVYITVLSDVRLGLLTEMRREHLLEQNIFVPFISECVIYVCCIE